MYGRVLPFYFLGKMIEDVVSYSILVLTIVSTIVNVVPSISLVISWKRLLFSDILLLNIFVTNLLLAIGYVLPIQSYFSGRLFPSHTKCVFTGYFVFFVACSNIVTMEALSIHRYILIKKPLYGGRFKNRKDIASVLVLFTWIYGAIVASPPLYGYSEYVPVVDLFTCELDFNTNTIENRAFVVFASIQGYILPAFVMGFCAYHCIFSNPLTLRSNRIDAKSPKEIRFTRAIYAMLFSFLVAWFPYVVVCFCSFINMDVSNVLFATCAVVAKASTIAVTVVYMMSYRGSRSLSFKFLTQVKKSAREEKLKTLVIYSSNLDESSAL